MWSEYKAFLFRGNLLLIIRAARRFDRRPPEDTPAPDSDEVILLREIRDALRARS